MQHRSFLLECTRTDFRPRTTRGRALTSVAATPRNAERCRRLWMAVGEGFWTERFRWTPERWARHLSADEVIFRVARAGNRDVGCFELTRMVRGVRIDGFGIVPAHRGHGLGRNLLTEATRRAFDLGAPKVWLHTATDDHPHALPNYLAGGYRVIRERPLRNPMPPTGRGLP